MTSPDAAPKRRNLVALIAGWVGLAAHLATGIWYVASGLLAPGWAVAVLLAIWVALLVAAILLLRTKPGYVLIIPVASAVIWFGALIAGETWLGWTA